jgi:hypothetical protein
MAMDYQFYGENYTGISDPQGLPTLEATWWGFETEPGMDDILTKAGDSLQGMIDRLKVHPFNGKSGERIFLAQYKIKSDGEMNLNFLGGFPLDCIEMMVLVGEYSSLPANVDVKAGDGKPIPPVPTKIFTWPEEDRIVFNKMAQAVRNSSSGLTAKMFADSLGSEAPKSHWWLNALFSSGQADQRKFPVPGEFLGLGVRIMFDKPWGNQKSSPLIYSGNWMDTIYYTSAVVKEVIAPSGDTPYPTYRVQWRKNEVTATPSDFAEYAVGDRVTILKEVDAEKTEQTWEDGDVEEFNKDKWVIAPVSFYDNGEGQGL